MRTRWNALRARLPRLPRKWRVIRNLILSGALLAVLPWALRWPALTDRAALAQLERAALLSPSEVVLRVGDAFLTQGEDWVSVGKLERYDSWWKPLQWKMPYLVHVIPKGGLIVAALPEVADGVLTVAVTGLPEGASAGELSLTISGVENPYGGMVSMEEREQFTASADRQGEWMFFRLEAHDHGENSQCILGCLWRELRLGMAIGQYPYVLELRDSGGGVVERIEGALPQDQRFLSGHLLLR